MPSFPRYLIIHDESTFHITWQCHNKEWFLKAPWAKKFYYDLLLKWKGRYGVSIYSYNFMDNHPHLAGTAKRKEGISNLMRIVNCLFAKEINKRLNRRGQVVMDRFKSSLIQTDKHLLNVMTYIDLNPCRAGKVIHPEKYKWSSYNYYAHGMEDPLITPAPSYLGLSDDSIQRCEIYKEMVEGLLLNVKIKKDYSKVRFIGDPDWVDKKYLNLREQKRKYVAFKKSSLNLQEDFP